ncbi:MAG: penicillin-binding protein 2 [Microthrixaceae bacterium]|nr:penicillin-binding protein 2 [Microthrixaceae bacterium]MCO5314020.1 penicillin-binding protein 2 [Microthrixaceae bacterium]
MVEDSSQTSPVRLAVLGVICVALFSAMFARLYYLQIIDHQTYQEVSQAVHQRTKQEEAPRGRILDRKGRVLVDNETIVVVGLDKEAARGAGLGNGEGSDRQSQIDLRTEMFNRLASVMTRLQQPVKVLELETLYTDRRYGPNDFIPIASDEVTEELQAFLIENKADFPGVSVRTRTVRSYPYGTRAAHILGYVGRVNAQELESELVTSQGTPEQPADENAKPYAASDEIGKAGIERTMERYLRGKPGITVIQVDARGQRIGTIKEPELEQGDDVWLTIDIDVQAYLEDELRNTVLSRRGNLAGCNPDPCNSTDGTSVILDPRNGQVLAIASYPSFDPSELVNGISTEAWERLTAKEYGEPMLNRATSKLFAPGSTYKLITSIAGLRAGVTTADEWYQDRGVYEIQNCKWACTRQNAGKARLGSVNLESAITKSSDTYFYRMGDLLWQRRDVLGESPIQDVAAEFGFGAKTGIQVTTEATGRIGTPAWLRDAYDANPGAFDHRDWTVGDNVNASIGQGMTDVTAIQLANAYAAFANGGTLFQPQIVLQVTHPMSMARTPADLENITTVLSWDPRTLRSERIAFNEVDYQAMYRGFIGVTQSGSGTARKSWQTFTPDFSVAGKTGTAQVHRKADTSLFVGWGPADPTGAVPAAYVIASIIPEGGFGDVASGALTMKVFRTLSRMEWPVASFTPTRSAAAGPTTNIPESVSTTTTTIPIAGSEPPLGSTGEAMPTESSVPATDGESPEVAPAGAAEAQTP